MFWIFPLIVMKIPVPGIQIIGVRKGIFLTWEKQLFNGFFRISKKTNRKKEPRVFIRMRWGRTAGPDDEATIIRGMVMILPPLLRLRIFCD